MKVARSHCSVCDGLLKENEEIVYLFLGNINYRMHNGVDISKSSSVLYPTIIHLECWIDRIKVKKRSKTINPVKSNSVQRRNEDT